MTSGYDFCLIQVAPDNENVIFLPNNQFLVSEDAGRTYRQIEGTLVHLWPHAAAVSPGPPGGDRFHSSAMIRPPLGTDFE